MEDFRAAGLLDDGRIDKLRGVMPDGDFRDLIDAWATAAEQHAARVSALARACDWGNLRREAHWLIGTAGSMGACRLEALGQQLHEACERAASADADACATAIAAATQQTVAAMRAQTDGEPSRRSG